MFFSKILSFMYDHTLHCWRKHFSSYSLQGFSAKEIKINDQQMIKIPKKDEYVKFRNYERKIKSPFIDYTDF